MKKTKPVKIKINLKPKDPFFDSVIGRVMRWALAAGRHIVIFTEIVVIISFLGRFTLDRQLTNVNGEIRDNESYVESYAQLEKDFRTAQGKIKQIKELNEKESLTAYFDYISDLTPQDISIADLKIMRGQVSLTGSTSSRSNLTLLINNFTLSPQFTDVRVDKISNRSDGIQGYQFSLSAKTKGGQVTASSTNQK